jgi:uncharacterized protein
MRRALVGVLIGLVVLVTAGLGAGGWYYTGELLPAPVAGEPTYDIEVVGGDEGAGELTLAATDGDLVDLARLGFWTADATLELGGVLDVDAAAVTRTATLVDGGWPEVGERGAATPVTFRGDPGTALGLPTSDLDISGPDGPLPAWQVVPDVVTDPGTHAVLVHGRGASREEMHRSLRTVHDAGIPALVVSVRNDPDAPADPDGWGRYGDTEWEDLQAAVDHLVEVESAERLLPMGSSQGGSLVLSWLRRGEHTERAVGAFLISPLTSMRGTLDLQARNRGIPAAVIPPLLWSTRLLAAGRSGMDFDRLEHADPDVVDTYTIPMLVTHGTADSTVPFADSVAFADARPDLVTLETYDEVEHVREWNADPERFDADLAAFLDEVVGTP